MSGCVITVFISPISLFELLPHVCNARLLCIAVCEALLYRKHTVDVSGEGNDCVAC